MKKGICLFLACMMSASLTACGSASADNSDTDAATAAETEAATNNESIEAASEKETATNNESTEEASEEEPAANNESAEAASEEEPAYYYVGDEVSSDYFTFTLKEVGITESLSLELGEDQALPLNGSTSVNADAGHKWLCYTVEYTYVGTKQINAVSSLFSPVVNYGDYTFDSDYFVFDTDMANWQWYLSDYDGTVSGLPVPATHGTDTYYEPLSGKTYCAKGAIQVPDGLLDGTEGTVILNLRNCTEYEMSGIMMEQVPFDITEELS